MRTGCKWWIPRPSRLWKDSSEGAEEIALGRKVPFTDSGERSRGRGHGVGSVPGAVSVLLWSPKGVEEDTVSVLYWCSLCAPLVQSLCSSGPQKEWKRTRSSEGAEEDTVLRRSGRGHGPQKEWKRTLSSERVEEDTVLVLFLVQSLCSSGSQRSGRGQGVGSVPGAVSVLLWYSGVEEDTVLVLFLVQSLCSLWSSEGDERLGLDRNKLGRLVPAFQRSKQVH